MQGQMRENKFQENNIKKQEPLEKQDFNDTEEIKLKSAMYNDDNEKLEKREVEENNAFTWGFVLGFILFLIILIFIVVFVK